MVQYKLDKLGEEYNLKVGDRLVLKDSLLEGYEIVYAGKPNDNKFSLIATEREFFGRLRMQGNLSFPVDKKKLSLEEKELGILGVDDESILLKHLK